MFKVKKSNLQSTIDLTLHVHVPSTLLSCNWRVPCEMKMYFAALSMGIEMNRSFFFSFCDEIDVKNR